MAKFNVEGIGEVEIPDNATREEAYAILQQRVNPTPPRQDLSIPQQAGAFFAGIGRGVASLPIVAAEALGGVTGSQGILDTAKQMRESDLGRMFTEVPENYRDRTASTAGEIAGNLITFLGPSAAANALRAPALVGRGLSLATGMGYGASEQVQRAEENRKQGMDVPLDQLASASRQGAATGLLDMLVLDRFIPGASKAVGLNIAKEAVERGWGQLAKRVGVTSLLGGAVEGGQQQLQNLIEGQYNPNQRSDEGVAENILLGAGVEGGLDLLLNSVAGRTGSKIMRTVNKAKRTPPKLEATDVDSVGVSQGEDGNPLISLLERIAPQQTSSIPPGPRENYVTPMELTEGQSYEQKVRSLMNGAPSLPPIDFPRENYKSAPPVAPEEKLSPKDIAKRDGATFEQRMQQMASAQQLPIQDILAQQAAQTSEVPAPGPRKEVVQPATVESAAPVAAGTDPIDRFHAAYAKLTGEGYGNAITLADVQQEMGITDKGQFTQMLADLDRGPGVTADGAKLSLPASTGTKGNNVYRNGDTSFYGIRFDKSESLDPDTFLVPTNKLNLDPARFQYKVEGIGQGGVGEELKTVQKWDPKRAGVISVWKDPDNGKTYIVNGHHRYELASRMGVPNLRVQYLDAPNAKAARSMGALLNISEGRGTSVDAAKFMRDTGTTAQEMAEQGTSLTSGIAKEASALSNLAPSLFDDVVHGNLNLKRAAIVGEGLESYTDQKAIIALAEKKRATDREVEEMIRLSKGDESTPAISSEQGGLFGDEPAETSSNIYEVAQLSSTIRQRLAQEKKLFGIVGDKAAASKLGTAGNKIKADANKQISDQANEALIVYDKLSRSESPITQSLRDGARRIANGENSELVREETYTAARNAVASLLPGSKVGIRKTDAGGKAASVQGVQPNKGKGTVDPSAKFSVATPRPVATTAYTIDSLAADIKAKKQPEIAMDVYTGMQNLGVDGLLATRLVDGISTPIGGQANGSYSNRIVQLAIKGKSKEAILSSLEHESVHAMQQMGLFTKLEWDILKAAFDPRTVLTDDEREQYGKLYHGDATAIQEEAIARGIERYAAGQMDVPRAAASIASKTVSMVDRLGNVLRGRGFQNAEDVMKAFRTGEMGAREAIIPADAPAPRTLKDYERGQYGNKEIANGQATQQGVQPTQNKQRGGRSTSIDDLLADDQTSEGEVGTAYSITPQLPVSGTSPFGKPDNRGPIKKELDTFAEKGDLGGAGLRGRQAILDMRASVAKVSRLASEKRGESFDKARTSSEAATRNFDSAGDLSSASMENGALEYVGVSGDGYFRVKDDKHNAPLTVFGEAHDKKKYERLTHYLIAERSDLLIKQNKELKISQADIDAWKKYGDDPEIKNWANRWKKFNDDQIDAWEASGRIDAETAKKFKHNFYLPYYRVEDDASVNFQGSGASMLTSPDIKALKGSKKDIGDPIDNIVRNTNMITSMALKNEADVRIARDGMQTDFIRQVVKKSINGETKYLAVNPNGEAVNSDRLMHAWVKGKEKHFEILDPILYDSVAASHAPLNLAVTVGKGFSKMLREGVTNDPVFMVNNGVFRDPAFVWLSGYTDFPFQGLLQSAYTAIKEGPAFKDLQRTGVIGNTIRGEGGATGTGKNLRQKVMKELHPFKSWQDFTRKSEAVNRITVYNSVMKRTGGDEAQAQYEARELLNFGRRGASPTMQAINALIPFQNAAWQGADVLYRGVMGRGANEKIQKHLAYRMFALAGLSALYTILVSDDERWLSADNNERDLNYFGPAGMKVKIPFEAGYIAKVFPERLTAMYLGHDDGKEFIGAFKRFIESTMKVSVLPQAAKPAWEVMMNQDSFRGKSIEPEYMRKKESSQRFDVYTTDLAKKIGEHTELLSPLQIDHLIRGYFGAMGVYTNALAGMLANPDSAKAAFSMEGRELNEIPVVGKFFQQKVGSRYMGEAYGIADDAIGATDMLKSGGERTDKRVNLARTGAAIKPLRSAMTDITKMETSIKQRMSAGEIDPKEARGMLHEFRQRKSELAKRITEIAKRNNVDLGVR